MTWQAVAQGCAPDHIDEYARVKRVFDGDTIELEDGRHVRLIGVNAMETGKDGKPSEPYADEAREALSSLLEPHTRIGMRLDEEHHDQYHRLLAHLYTSGSNSIEAWLLENGYALVIAVPPNVWNLECYRQAEQRARMRQKGLWSESYETVTDAATLDNDAQGFHVIKGRVNQVNDTAKSVWLDLEGGVALRIDRGDLHNFDGIKFKELLQRQVIARGWVHRDHDRAVIRLRHSALLEVLN